MSELGKFNGSYPNLFRGADSEAIEGGFTDVWGWYINLEMMSKGRLEMWDYLTEMNVTKFMNYLSFNYDKAKYESDLMKEQMKKR